MADTASARTGLPRGRVRTPTVLQMEFVECGAACLGIILGYYGRMVPLAELRRNCGVSRDGTNACNMVRAASSYGLVAKGFKKEVHDLLALSYPYIVFWNFNHFVVVEGFYSGRVFLNDPATGPRTVTFEEFDESFTGVVLTMEPESGFRAGGKRPGAIRGLAVRLRTSVGILGLCSLTSLLLVLPGLATAAFTQIFVDNVLVRRMEDWARPIILGLVVAALVRGMLSAVQLRLLRRLKLKLAVTMSGKFVWHLLRLPADFYAQRYSGEVAGRVGFNDRAADLMSGQLASSSIDILMMVFYGIVMFQFDAVLTAIAVGFAAAHFLLLRWIARRRVDANQRLVQDYGKLGGVTIAGLQSIRTVKASALESDLFARIAGNYARAVNTEQGLMIANLYLTLLPRFLSALMTMLILVLGGLRVIDGVLTIGMLVAFQSLAASFLGPVNNLLNLGGALQELEGNINRLDDVLRNPVDDKETPPLADGGPIRLTGLLELEDVRFGYNPLAPPLIDGLSLKLDPGRRVALVGASGSGKSTVARLVAGLYEPSGGNILFDGKRRSQIPGSVMTNSLQMVDQEIVLFGGTIRDNLTLWDPTIPEDQLVQAARDAAIHDDILALPDGYATMLLEGGANLSGGQRQRLEIARALCADPSILVLDEATSSLDAETERLIDRNLRRRGCSCLIVAHRLSTIRDADEIIVLDRGKVVERGTHDEMLGEGGTYWQLLHTADSLAEEYAGS